MTLTLFTHPNAYTPNEGALRMLLVENSQEEAGKPGIAMSCTRQVKMLIPQSSARHRV